jgi:hypothetical protein
MRVCQYLAVIGRWKLFSKKSNLNFDQSSISSIKQRNGILAIMAQLSCLVCLVRVTGRCALTTHLIKHHGWICLRYASTRPLIRMAAYYWRFQYIHHCLTLLNSSQTRNEYLAGVALLAPFDPLVHPPGYHAEDTKEQKQAAAKHRKGEYDRVAKEWFDFPCVHPILGKSELLTKIKD